MIFFRADGNSNIGSGHVMRCLSIAREASSDYEILFITADEAFASTVKSVGISNHILHTDYRNLSLELEQMQGLIEFYHPSALFVDSYYVTKSYLSVLWESCMRVGCKLIYIDDLVKFAYSCDILLDYNIYGTDKRLAYQKLYCDAGIQEPNLLLGASYAPLRMEFRNLMPRKVRPQATDILISTGGADFEHITIRILEEVIKSQLHFTFHFIIGSMNKDRTDIENLALNSKNSHIILHHNVTAMAELMQSVDLAVSAAGSTLYELCATQTPTITFILADNQILGAEGFEKHEILSCCGDFRNEQHLITKLLKESVSLANDYDKRVSMVQKMRTIVDGRGCRKIIDAVL